MIKKTGQTKQRQKSESAIVKVIVEKALIINPSSVVCACVIRCCLLCVSRRLPSVLHQTKHILFLSYLLDFVLCTLLRLVRWKYRLDNQTGPHPVIIRTGTILLRPSDNVTTNVVQYLLHAFIVLHSNWLSVKVSGNPFLSYIFRLTFI